ncbi:MAG TPA: peptide chain release factor 3 [Firmicutes bacterium]|nr:peptide chain release factor 3 [Bacillota bacterium]
MDIKREAEKRKTFAIISHPDAGKTTLTEKFLLFAGAINMAGAVKSNKITKTTVSDFMEIEKQRGISVASAVMSFEYDGLKINLLDTPGHKDFAEDTYRTLTAVDSVILVVDGVKGVEEQTEKLMNVCRMRNTPVIIFINKLDREGGDFVELLDSLEEKLAIKVCPLTWPISRGSEFKGVYSIHHGALNLFKPHEGRSADSVTVLDVMSKEIDERVGGYLAEKLREDLDLVKGVYGDFDREMYLAGKTAPVFFGSALNNFGVKEMLDTFIRIAPMPGLMRAQERTVEPFEEKLTGFIFKIHANIDLRHRDRIAFFRVCSGRFEKNKFYRHVRTGADLRFPTPAEFLGQNKDVIDEAYPGDVIGLYDRKNFKIGDTLTEGESLHFKGIPSFSPEFFKELVHTAMKAKQLEKGINQLMDEGVAQFFLTRHTNRKIIGTVGQLQFEVIKYRLEHEYGAECRFESFKAHKACWIRSENKAVFDEFCRLKEDRIGTDKDGNTVFFVESEWMLNGHIEANPEIEFYFTSEFEDRKEYA